MFSKYNRLGKICFFFVFTNLSLAFFLAINNNFLAILNLLIAFLCHLTTFSKKCLK